MRKRTTAVLLAASVAVLMALPAAAALPKLPGTVGPGFTINMKKPTKAGKYSLVVRDLSDMHNFHLKGPGVNVKTSVAAKGTRTFTIKVVKGKYSFVCDPHASTMKGSFTIR
jgi:Copper binding proteins, plastocyanin/azurin family